jgi:hypothetical protein
VLANAEIRRDIKNPPFHPHKWNKYGGNAAALHLHWIFATYCRWFIIRVGIEEKGEYRLKNTVHLPSPSKEVVKFIKDDL